MDWTQYLDITTRFAVDHRISINSPFTNSLFAAQVCKDAIVDVIKAKKRARPNVDVRNPDVLINLHVDKYVSLFL